MTFRPKSWKTALKVNNFLYWVIFVITLAICAVVGICFLFKIYSAIIPGGLLFAFCGYTLHSIEKNIERCKIEISYEQ